VSWAQHCSFVTFVDKENQKKLQEDLNALEKWTRRMSLYGPEGPYSRFGFRFAHGAPYVHGELKYRTFSISSMSRAVRTGAHTTKYVYRTRD
jgi:hypothetical protein